MLTSITAGNSFRFSLLLITTLAAFLSTASSGVKAGVISIHNEGLSQFVTRYETDDPITGRQEIIIGTGTLWEVALNITEDRLFEDDPVSNSVTAADRLTIGIVVIHRIAPHGEPAGPALILGFDIESEALNIPSDQRVTLEAFDVDFRDHEVGNNEHFDFVGASLSYDVLRVNTTNGDQITDILGYRLRVEGLHIPAPDSLPLIAAAMVLLLFLRRKPRRSFDT